MESTDVLAKGVFVSERRCFGAAFDVLSETEAGVDEVCSSLSSKLV